MGDFGLDNPSSPHPRAENYPHLHGEETNLCEPQQLNNPRNPGFQANFGNLHNICDVPSIPSPRSAPVLAIMS